MISVSVRTVEVQVQNLVADHDVLSWMHEQASHALPWYLVSWYANHFFRRSGLGVECCRHNQSVSTIQDFRPFTGH